MCDRSTLPDNLLYGRCEDICTLLEICLADVEWRDEANDLRDGGSGDEEAFLLAPLGNAARKLLGSGRAVCELNADHQTLTTDVENGGGHRWTRTQLLERREQLL